MTKYLVVLFLVATLAAGTASAQDSPKFKGAILLSPAGQSADTKLVGMILKRLKLEAKELNSARSADLSGVGVLIVVPGFSSKGLGAAGISQEQELARVKELLAGAKQKSIPVVCVHIGGNARRKGQSDDFNKAVAEISKLMIIVKQGDEDGFFSQIASQKRIPIRLVEKIADVQEELKKVF